MAAGILRTYNPHPGRVYPDVSIYPQQPGPMVIGPVQSAGGNHRPAKPGADPVRNPIPPWVHRNRRGCTPGSPQNIVHPCENGQILTGSSVTLSVASVFFHRKQSHISKYAGFLFFQILCSTADFQFALTLPLLLPFTEYPGQRP